jgi:uncharacterized protein with LGFP repeats
MRIRTFVVSFTVFSSVALFANVAYACSPYGLIGEKWRKLGGVGSALGNCLEDEKDDGEGGRIQNFKSGFIDWDGHANEAFEVRGLIGEKWRQVGLAKFGHPTTDERGAPDGFGRYNYFVKNGAPSTIYFTPHSVFCPRVTPCVPQLVYGAILIEWGKQSYERGRLGYPTSDEEDKSGSGTVSGERISHFEHGTISWRPDGSILTKLFDDLCLTETGSYKSHDERNPPDKYCSSL